MSIKIGTEQTGYLDASGQQVLFPSGNEGLYYIPSNSFRYTQPPVPMHLFEQERLTAIASPRQTAEIVLDLSTQMGLEYPATTPHLLARYLCIAAGDNHRTQARAISEIYYVLEGTGKSTRDGVEYSWRAGDVLVLPGGEPTIHSADAEGALLFLATDEPMLAFSGAMPATGASATVKPAYFPLEGINRYLDVAHSRPATSDDTSKTVVFVTERTAQVRSTTPWMTTNLNTLVPGGDQRPHRHNAAALTLSIAGDDVHSVVDGHRVDWRKFGVMLTPPTAVHSHHNRGTRMMRSFVVQDSGLFYYARATGFSFGDE